MNTFKRTISTLGAACLALGSITVIVTAAQASPPQGCTQTAGVPYQLPNRQVTGSGFANCNSPAPRTFVYEIHRSEGWWHPIAALTEDRGRKTKYQAQATDCDAGSGSGNWEYFGQAYFSGHSYTISGNTTGMNICG